jgi:acetyl esterase/lipase
MAGEAKAKLKKASEAAAAEAKAGKSSHTPLQSNGFKAPGRLGDPGMELQDEPRVNANLLAAVTPLGMNKFAPPQTLAKLSENSTLEEISEMIAEFENGVLMLYNGQIIPLDLPSDKEQQIEQTEETIKGGDGQDMKVYIYRPTNFGSGKLPGVVYTHGGGMTIIPTFNPVHDKWARGLAAQGAVVVMVDFRNAYTKEKYNHFPKGLNDCVAGFRWVYANRDKLNIGKLIITGESGGGNLACAVTLKANREGWVNEISGVYAIIPYISNLYGASDERLLKELPSLIENHGYFLNIHANAYMGHFYTPNDKDGEDPLAWPYFATEKDMKGLPPHVVLMDELDPLRDEGMSYARRLVKAGVPTRSSMTLGTLHGAPLLMRAVLPEINAGITKDVVTFAKSL